MGAGEQLSRWHRLAAPSQRPQISTLAVPDSGPYPRLSPEHADDCGVPRDAVDLPVWSDPHDSPGSGSIPDRDPGDGLSVGPSLVESGVFRAGVPRGSNPCWVAIRPRATTYSPPQGGRVEADLIPDGRRGGPADLPLELVARRGRWFTRLSAFPPPWAHPAGGVGRQPRSRCRRETLPSWYAPRPTPR